MRGTRIAVVNAIATCGGFEIVLSDSAPIADPDLSEVSACSYVARPIEPAQHKHTARKAVYVRRVPRMQGHPRKVALSPADEYG